MYKVSAKKTVEELCLKESSVHPLLSAGELSLQNFQKVEGLDRTSSFRGGLLGKRGMTFFKGGVAIFT